jgi:Xaa-Pro aminopeptidase
MNYDKRLAALQKRMQEAGLGFVVVTSWQNLFYFTGITNIHGETRGASQMPMVVPANGGVTFVPTQGFSKAVSAEHTEIKSVLPFAEDAGIYPFKSRWQRVAEAIGVSELRREPVVVEMGTLTVPNYMELEKELDRGPLGPADPILREMRATKDADELDCLRRAARLTDRIMEEVIVRYLVPGLTERQLANRLREAALRYEVEAAFVQVFAGHRGYFQNIAPSDNKVKEHEVLLIDWGIRYGNYNTDITRAFCLGDPGRKQEETCATVAEILDEAVGMMRPGITCGSVDDFVKAEFKSRGIEDLWIHRLGHGMGIDVSEWPYLAGVDTTTIKANMVFAVEPGIYYPDFGIRLEDNVIVLEDGCEVLTKTPRSIKVI